MYRFILGNLKDWQKENRPHPLIIRGARQVGKSFLIEEFGQKCFDKIVKINFEQETRYKKFFDHLEPVNILNQISQLKKQDIEVGTTLLFLDEIQECPQAIKALRYFYEEIPGLHVIAAGSLLEFTLKSEDFKLPVGRIHYRFLQPMSFYEYLLAKNHSRLIDYLRNINIGDEIEDTFHQTLLEEVRVYMLIGGMPEAVETYVRTNSFNKAFEIQEAIKAVYRDDFGKYSSLSKHQYLDKVFEKIPQSLGKKFKYSAVDPDDQSKDLKEALSLLTHAGLAVKVRRNSAAQLPLGAQASMKHFKVIFVDIGVAHNILGTDIESVFFNDLHSNSLSGLTEQFVGQELLASLDFHKERNLYFWEREAYHSSAEVDYLVPIKSQVIPIEVKAGSRGKLQSLNLFMEQYSAPVGVKISKDKFYFKPEEKFLSIPLYMVAELERLVKKFTSAANIFGYCAQIPV